MMLEVEFVPSNSSNEREYYIRINGKSFEDQIAYARYITPDHIGVAFSIDIDNEDAANLLLNSSIDELFNYFDRITLPVAVHREHINIELDLVNEGQYVPIFDGDDAAITSLRVRCNLADWNMPYSVSDFYQALKDVMQRDPISDVRISINGQSVVRGAKFEFSPLSYDVPARLEASNWTPRLLSVIAQVDEALVNAARGDVLATVFSFPPELRSACEQYLMYFAQFLADLGMDVQTEVQQQAGETLFTIRPESGPDALEKIKAALNTYLSLPFDPDVERDASVSTDIAALHLNSQIYHLRSQAALAEAMIKAQNAHIKALDLQVFNYEQRIKEMAAVPAVLPIPADAQPVSADEPILGGFVSLVPVDLKFAKINTGHLFRQLRRRFKKN